MSHPMEGYDNVYSIEEAPSHCGREYINGEAVELGRLTLQDMLDLQAEAEQRRDAAATDLMMINDHIDRKFSFDGGDVS